ncbi:MAG: HMA2 domain-containing protein [Chloroflexota bacterium]
MATSAPGDIKHGHIVSHIAGRMRVRLHEEHRDAETLEQIEDGLCSHEGVDAVTTNPRTGSILVNYDHERLSKDDLTSLLRDAGLIARDLLGAEEIPDDLGESAPPTHSSTATSLLDALTDLDMRLSRMTNGRLDVKLLVPAGLGLLALRQIALNGLGLGQVPGYVLLWYTFDSFYKLHQRKLEAVAGEIVGDEESTDDADAGGPGA